MDEGRAYFAMFKLASDAHDRRLNTLAVFMGLIDDWSSGERLAIAHADNGHLSAHFFKSKLNAGQMQARFREKPGVGKDDSILIFEVGSDYNGSGFSRAWTWLQHHR